MTLDLPFRASRATFVHHLQTAQAAAPLSSLVVSVDHEPREHFVQFLFWDRTTVQWEVGTYRTSGGLWRKHHVFLTAEQQARLQAHGFRYDRAESPNYTRLEHLTDDHHVQRIVDESCGLFTTVYAANPVAALCFERIA